MSPRPLSAFTSFRPPPPPPAQGPHSPWSCDAPVHVLTRCPDSMWPSSTASRSQHHPHLWARPSWLRCTQPSPLRLSLRTILSPGVFCCLTGGHTIICPSFVSSAGRKPSEICPAPEWCVARGSLGEYLLNEWMSPWDGGSRSVYGRVLVGGQWCF